jgi:hypothetical protein
MFLSRWKRGRDNDQIEIRKTTNCVQEVLEDECEDWEINRQSRI